MQMVRFFVIVTFILLCVAAAFSARPWTPDDDVTNGIPVEGAVQISSQTLGIGHLIIQIHDPLVKMEQVDLNKQMWTMVTIDGETRLWQNGKPALPLISRAVRLPNKGNVNLVVTPGEFVEYQNIDVMPQQPTDLVKVGDHFEPVQYTYDESIYKTDAWYPSQIGLLTPPEIIRDARVALLGIQPVQYNPVTHVLRVYKSIDIEIMPIGGTGENELMSSNSHAVPSFAEIYEDIIGADDLLDDARSAAPGQILFVARAGADTLIKPWTDWKTQSGHPCQIFTAPTSISTAQALQTIITNDYNTMNPPLESVMLIGDAGGSGSAEFDIPTYSDGGAYSDHRYGMLTTGSINVSIWIGRIHCDNASELQMQMNKSMNYERIPVMSDTTWFTRGWGYAGTGNNIVSNPPCIRFCLSMMVARGVTNVLYDEHSGYVDANLITTRLSPGATYWAHRASWISQIQASNVSGINNINKPFVGFNISCGTGDWVGPSAGGIHVALTKLGSPTQPKGALASVSTQTSGTNPAHNNVMAAGSMYGLGVKNARMPGPMFFEGKYQLWRNYRIGDSTNASNFIFWNNPLGDNTAMVWTGVPRYVTSNLPNSVGIGQNRIDMQVLRGTVPVSGALVTAWKKSAGGTTETYYRAVTDDSGRVTLNLSNTTAGNMLVTVTGNKVGQNIYPYRDTVVVAATPVDLSVSNVTIIDSPVNGRTGNSNSTANPGETLDLAVQLTNRGTNLATGISGTLSTTDPRITILTQQASWANDSAGQSVGITVPFRVSLANTMHDLESIPLRLDLIYEGGTRTVTVPLLVRSIAMRFISASFTPTTIIPGGGADVSVTAMNYGGLSTSNTSNMTLFSTSPTVSVTVSDVTLTGIPAMTNITNPSDRRFHIITSSQTYPGSIISLGCVYTSGTVSDTVYFTMSVGTRTSTYPTGPDAYGYVAYDNTDTSYTDHPTYSWAEIIPALGGSGTRLGLNDNTIQANSASSDVATVVRLPFTAHYYGAAYDSVTICSNGWLAFGGQRSPDNGPGGSGGGHVPYNNSRNWHLPAHEGPRNLVAVDWCDQTNTGTNEGAYTKYDSTGHRFIVTWKTTTLYSPAAQEYQLFIYDATHETPTGDSQLKMQFKTYNPAAYSGGESGVSYATVGIEDSNYTRAVEYCYWNTYTPGSALIPNGTPSSGQRAILYTTVTQQNPATGTLVGSVRRVAGNNPIRNASVMVLNGGFSAITDTSGNYTIANIPVGNYRVHATGFNFNTAVDSVVIVQNQTDSANFLLGAPELLITLHPQDTSMVQGDSLWATLLDTGETSVGRIYIHNNGDAPLTWNSQLLYDGGFDRAGHGLPPVPPVSPSTDELDTLFNQVYSFDATEACGGDRILNGVEFDGQHFWITGASSNYNRPHHLYKLDRTGQLLHTYNCPDSTTLYGWRDLAWDGHYLYGSYGNYIDKIDTSNGTIVQRYLTSVNPVRAIAVDTAAGIIYYCDQSSAINRMNMATGVTLPTTLPNPSGGGVFGLAFYPSDPDTMKLYAFCRDSSGHSLGSRVYKLNTTTGASRSVIRLGTATENAAGLATTPRWDPMLWTLVTLTNQTNADSRVGVYELLFNSTWIYYTPQVDTVQPGHIDTVTVSLNSRFMPDSRYRVALQFNTNATIQTAIVPIVMIVTPVTSVGNPVHSNTLPHEFTLEQNYPNPFNPVTTISFGLPKTALVKFTIYDELGREVARLVNNNSISAGRHTIAFDGSRLASGVYFYRLEAGSYVAARKMLLLK